LNLQLAYRREHGGNTGVRNLKRAAALKIPPKKVAFSALEYIHGAILAGRAGNSGVL